MLAPPAIELDSEPNLKPKNQRGVGPHSSSLLNLRPTFLRPHNVLLVLSQTRTIQVHKQRIGIGVGSVGPHNLVGWYGRQLFYDDK